MHAILFAGLALLATAGYVVASDLRLRWRRMCRPPGPPPWRPAGVPWGPIYGTPVLSWDAENRRSRIDRIVWVCRIDGCPGHESEDGARFHAATWWFPHELRTRVAIEEYLEATRKENVHA